jgi:hypothetical protein
VRVYQEAEKLLSRRYFSGEDLYYPASREELTSLLASVEESEDLYLQAVAPELTRGQEQKAGEEKDEGGQEEVLVTDINGGDPATAKRARDYAGQLVVLAKAEALADLGEKNRASGWLRTGCGTRRAGISEHA